MSFDICELCGNPSVRYTCQMCVTTGNFWIDKAKFSYNGNKQFVLKLMKEKENLQKQVAQAYYSSYGFKDSVKKYLLSSINSMNNRIKETDRQKDLLNNRIANLKANIAKKNLSITEISEKIEKQKDDIQKIESSIVQKEELLTKKKLEIKSLSQKVIRTLNKSIFKLSKSSDKSMCVLNINFRECSNAAIYIKQIKGYQNEDISHNTCIVLSLLVQFTEILAVLMNCHLPYQLDQNTFVSHTKSSRLLFTYIKQLSSNILHLCLSQHVHPELLEPYAYVGNLQQLLESDETCGIGPFCHSLDRPGDSDTEETPPPSSDSDAEWETVPQSEVAQQDQQLAPSTSFIGSLIWNSSPAT